MNDTVPILCLIAVALYLPAAYGFHMLLGMYYHYIEYGGQTLLRKVCISAFGLECLTVLSGAVMGAMQYEARHHIVGASTMHMAVDVGLLVAMICLGAAMVFYIATALVADIFWGASIDL